MHTGFQMTVESNHAIALVLVLVAFRMGSKNGEYCYYSTSYKQGIGVGLTSRSSCLVKPSVVLVLVLVTPSHFQRK